MTVGPIGGPPPVGLPPHTDAVADAARPGFADALGHGLTQVSALEHRADALVADVVSGGQTPVHEAMIATTQATIATDLLVHVRDRALEAYHEVMRLQL